MITINGLYSWSFVTRTFYQVMIATINFRILHLGLFDSVASLLIANLYIENPDRERYLFHMQVLLEFYKWNVHNGKTAIISVVVQYPPQSSPPHCQMLCRSCHDKNQVISKNMAFILCSARLHNFDNNHGMLALHDIYLHIMWKQLKVFLAQLTDNFVHPMLPVSLGCPFWLPLRYSLTFICNW